MSLSHASLSHALLGLLVDRPASGYDLLKRFDISLAAVWPATQSQIYTELGRLAAAGLIEAAAEGPRGRKEYAVTGAGLAELRRWLTETTPRQIRRNEPLLRVFFLGVLTREQAQAYLAGMAAQAARDSDELKALDDSISWDDSSLALYGRLAIEWVHRFTVFQREWAEWAVDQVAADDSRPGPPDPRLPAGRPPRDEPGGLPPRARWGGWPWLRLRVRWGRSCSAGHLCPGRVRRLAP